MKLIVATKNRHKLKEMQEILNIPQLRLLSLLDVENPPTIVEDGATFEENALIKARRVAKALSCWALADDSGIEVDALDKAPGVHSARFGGGGLNDSERNLFLLSKLKGVPPEKRSARFRCVMALVSPHGEEVTAEGVCEGRIAFEPRGEHGFGYDPVFLLDDGRTMAELPPGEKNLISHRYRALMAMKPRLMEMMKRGNAR